ncbi:MAG: hypothetical protein KC505_00150 [Myxococcales bacterium]|nr:hypothetical protein [Myxococcales bacterium]USN51081.1 MAG: hypothetical protein H6731_01335 [Myxococcales bacterium]
MLKLLLPSLLLLGFSLLAGHNNLMVCITLQEREMSIKHSVDEFLQNYNEYKSDADSTAIITRINDERVLFKGSIQEAHDFFANSPIKSLKNFLYSLWEAACDINDEYIQSNAACQK